MKRFVYLRLFLTATETPPLLARMEEQGSQVGREQHLQQTFSKKWIFTHRGTDLIYIPIVREYNEREDVVFGRVGKQVVNLENAGPDEEFEATQHTSWRAANLLTYTSSAEDGQILAFEDRGDVGKPLAIANSLVDHINRSEFSDGWIISVNQMTEQNSFWEAVEKYKGQITRAEFNYVTPNVLGIRSTLNQRLKDYRQKENAKEVSVTLKEDSGNLELNTEEVRDAVEYIAEGGGSTKLKAGRETLYDSEDTERARDIDTDDDVRFGEPEGRQRIARTLFGG